VLLCRIEPGGTVPVGAPIAVIGQPGEDTARYRLYQPGDPQPPSSGPSAAAPAGQPAQAAPAQTDRQEAAAGRAAASPLARRVAASLSVDLATVTGTGPDGRITREDVERAAQQR
jgi:pyruvate dehydrogenase E2 component (dihydrolipoyllysine-residue acetyltransferase)